MRATSNASERLLAPPTRQGQGVYIIKGLLHTQVAKFLYKTFISIHHCFEFCAYLFAAMQPPQSKRRWILALPTIP